jgi:hypothetical protein
MELISKKEALSKGLKRYFTGKPCRHGHVCERFVSDGNCKQCRVNLNSKNKYREDYESYHKEYYKNNKHIVLSKRKAYAQKNSDRINALIAKRRHSKDMRTPAWANLELIRKVYEKCKVTTNRTGVKHHVDHIVPLHSDLVCGLHVHYNLQILPASENCSKSNKFEIV